MNWLEKLEKHFKEIAERDSDLADVLRYNLKLCLNYSKYFPHDPIVRIFPNNEFNLFWNEWEEYDKASLLAFRGSCKRDVYLNYMLNSRKEKFPIYYVKLNDITEDHFPKRIIKIVHNEK